MGHRRAETERADGEMIAETGRAEQSRVSRAEQREGREGEQDREKQGGGNRAER